jgi:anti-sigma factor RsiW
MNCEVAHEWIVTAAYGELADAQAHELDRHLDGCARCQNEREQLLALKVLANAYPVMEPEANLIARSRLKLDDLLDALPPRRWYERLSQRMGNSMARLLAVPVAAGLLLAVGIGAGSLGGFRIAQYRAERATATQAAREQLQTNASSMVSAQAEIANISSIVREPNSHRVEVRYNQMVPRQVEGSLDDPAIRQLLMLASANSALAGVRDDSVGLMAAECRAGHGCQAAGIRDALMVALRYDKNAAVRQKALHGLEPYVVEDVRVRNAVLEALLNDSDARIRTAAINILEPVEADTSVRQVLHSVANTDRNPYIRTVSRQVLESVPEIQ